MRAANISLSTGFSPKPFGMIFSLRRSSTKRRSRRRVALEVVLEAGDRARQDAGVVRPDALGEVARDCPRRSLVTSRRPSLELGPEIGRDLHGKIAHPVRQAALSG